MMNFTANELAEEAMAGNFASVIEWAFHRDVPRGNAMVVRIRHCLMDSSRTILVQCEHPLYNQLLNCTHLFRGGI